MAIDTERQFTPIMFVRDVDDAVSHITDGWQGQAFCGAMPQMREIGWTLGARSAWLNDLTVCEDCKSARSALMTRLAARR